ncbi:hypothetical protein HDU84_003005 [Entophlyctis sp. JEL0112]|nr:hypothetical protein HDU84_003005 [Entophlyctis sp. JEL0112]
MAVNLWDYKSKLMSLRLVLLSTQGVSPETVADASAAVGRFLRVAAVPEPDAVFALGCSPAAEHLQRCVRVAVDAVPPSVAGRSALADRLTLVAVVVGAVEPPHVLEASLRAAVAGANDARSTPLVAVTAHMHLLHDAPAPGLLRQPGLPPLQPQPQPPPPSTAALKQTHRQSPYVRLKIFRHPSTLTLWDALRESSMFLTRLTSVRMSGAELWVRGMHSAKHGTPVLSRMGPQQSVFLNRTTVARPASDYNTATSVDCVHEVVWCESDPKELFGDELTKGGILFGPNSADFPTHRLIQSDDNKFELRCLTSTKLAAPPPQDALPEVVVKKEIELEREPLQISNETSSLLRDGEWPSLDIQNLLKAFISVLSKHDDAISEDTSLKIVESFRMLAVFIKDDNYAVNLFPSAMADSTRERLCIDLVKEILKICNDTARGPLGPECTALHDIRTAANKRFLEFASASAGGEPPPKRRTVKALDKTFSSHRATRPRSGAAHRAGLDPRMVASYLFVPPARERGVEDFSGKGKAGERHTLWSRCMSSREEAEVGRRVRSAEMEDVWERGMNTTTVPSGAGMGGGGRLLPIAFD